MNVKKVSLEGLQGEALEVAKAINGMVDAISEKDSQISGLKSQIEAIERMDISGYATQIDSLKNIVADLEAKQTAGVAEKELSPVDSIVSEIKKLGINSVSELKSYVKKNGTQEFAIKAITALTTGANSDTVGRTNIDMRIAWTPTIGNAFLQNLRTVAEDSDKSTFAYMEGTYTGNAAYVGEGGSNANSDSATASASTMIYAKIQEVLTVNTEVYEDIPDFAQGLVSQMTIAIQKFVDDEALSGDGSNVGGVKHMHGLYASYATAFVPADYAATVKTPHVGNLLSAVVTDIAIKGKGAYAANIAFMHPKDLFVLKNIKDAEGNPVVMTDVFGNPIIDGLRIIPTAKITANTLLVMDSRVAELRTKRSMTLKIGQILTDDVIKDKQSAIMMARYQLLVRNADKAGVVKVTDVAAALTAITKA
jgi:hypothetical protein